MSYCTVIFIGHGSCQAVVRLIVRNHATLLMINEWIICINRLHSQSPYTGVEWHQYIKWSKLYSLCFPAVTARNSSPSFYLNYLDSELETLGRFNYANCSQVLLFTNFCLRSFLGNVYKWYPKLKIDKWFTFFPLQIVILFLKLEFWI